MSLSFFEPRVVPLCSTFIHCSERMPVLKRSHSFSGYRAYDTLPDMSDKIEQEFRNEDMDVCKAPPDLSCGVTSSSVARRSRTLPLALQALESNVEDIWDIDNVGIVEMSMSCCDGQDQEASNSDDQTMEPVCAWHSTNGNECPMHDTVMKGIPIHEFMDKAYVCAASISQNDNIIRAVKAAHGNKLFALGALAERWIETFASDAESFRNGHQILELFRKTAGVDEGHYYTMCLELKRHLENWASTTSVPPCWSPWCDMDIQQGCTDNTGIIEMTADGPTCDSQNFCRIEADDRDEKTYEAWPDTDSEASDWCSTYADLCSSSLQADANNTGGNVCKTLNLATLLATPAPDGPHQNFAPKTSTLLHGSSGLPIGAPIGANDETSANRIITQRGLPTLLGSQPRPPIECKTSKLSVSAPIISLQPVVAAEEVNAPSMPPSSKPWRGKINVQEPMEVLDDPQNITTLMIRNLPLDLSQADFLDEVNASGFRGTYDFAYIPQCFDRDENKGFAFINFLNPATAGGFVGCWHKQHRFDRKPTDAPISISPAAIQGFEANMQKWAGARMRRIKDPRLRPFVMEQMQQTNPSMYFSKSTAQRGFPLPIGLQ